MVVGPGKATRPWSKNVDNVDDMKCWDYGLHMTFHSKKVPELGNVTISVEREASDIYHHLTS